MRLASACVVVGGSLIAGGAVLAYKLQLQKGGCAPLDAEGDGGARRAPRISDGERPPASCATTNKPDLKLIEHS